MGKIALITGGARSGKSGFAENEAKKLGDKVLYIATALPTDDEMKLRIKIHQESRPKNWITEESYKDIDKIIERYHSKDAVIIECITIMVSNLMFDMSYGQNSYSQEQNNDIEIYIKKYVKDIINASKKSEAVVFFITNEVGMGIVPDNAVSRMFRDIAGRVNSLIASEADDVYMCVSGIPMKIKSVKV